MAFSSDWSVVDDARELRVQWSTDQFRTPTAPLVLGWQVQRAEQRKTAGHWVGAVGLEPTTVLPCKWHAGLLTR
jgi:hypothetical protein